MLGFLGPILGGLGKSAIAKTVVGAAGGYLGGILGNKLDAQRQQDNFGFLRDQGLTPTEIAGGGGAGGISGTSGATLGNNYTQMARDAVQMAFQREERDKDRAVQLAGQETQLASARTSAAATLGSARMSAQTAANRLALDRDVYENINLPKGLNDAITSSPEFVKSRIMATMAADNILATAIANDFGINPFDKDALADVSESQLRDMVRMIQGYKSNVFSETAGAGQIISEGVQEGVKDAGEAVRGLGNRLGDWWRGDSQ